MTNCEPGDVVLVRFPFTDLTTSKKRPALVISPNDFSRRYGDVVLIALTSQPQRETDHALQDWQSAGLPKPTWLKPLMATLSATIVERRLGKLSSIDCTRAGLLLRTLIAPVFTS